MSFPISAPPSEPQIRGHFYWVLKGTLSLGHNSAFWSACLERFLARILAPIAERLDSTPTSLTMIQ